MKTSEAFLSKAWYLVYTKPRQEQVAETNLANLANQGYAVYLSMLNVHRRSRYCSLIEPLFPRDIFIYLDQDSDNWNPGEIIVFFIATNVLKKAYLNGSFNED